MSAAAWGWVGIGVANLLGIAGLDAWLISTGRHSLTRQMHDWVFQTQWAQLIIPLAAGLLIWFIVHEIIYHPHGT